MDVVTGEEETELNRLLAEFIYSSGLPFNVVSWFLHQRVGMLHAKAHDHAG